MGDEGNPFPLLHQLWSQFALQPFNPTVGTIWVPVWSGMVLVKAAFCMQKENNCFFWVLVVLYELHPPLIESSRAGFEGACASGQPVKWNHHSSHKLGFKIQIWKGSKIFVWIAVPLCYISVLFHSLASGKVFGLQWVFSMLSLCSSEWKLFMRSLYNVGSSSVLRVFWSVWRWGLEDAQYLGTSDATGKLPWIQTIWSRLVAKTTGLHFLAYTPPNCFIDTLRKC